MSEHEEKAPRAPKVTIRETPSETHVREALKETIVEDARGRKIKLVRPPVLAQFKLIRMLGGEASANQTYVQMLLPLLYVAAIDGAPVFFPASELEIDALIARLDEDGIACVMKGVVENFAEQSSDERRATVKN